MAQHDEAVQIILQVVSSNKHFLLNFVFCQKNKLWLSIFLSQVKLRHPSYRYTWFSQQSTETKRQKSAQKVAMRLKHAIRVWTWRKKSYSSFKKQGPEQIDVYNTICLTLTVDGVVCVPPTTNAQLFFIGRIKDVIWVLCWCQIVGPQCESPLRPHLQYKLYDHRNPKDQECPKS